MFAITPFLIEDEFATPFLQCLEINAVAVVSPTFAPCRSTIVNAIVLALVVGFAPALVSIERSFVVRRVNAIFNFSVRIVIG